MEHVLGRATAFMAAHTRIRRATLCLCHRHCSILRPSNRRTSMKLVKADLDTPTVRHINMHVCMSSKKIIFAPSPAVRDANAARGGGVELCSSG